jgi:CheY-like chemotaxis protein
LILAPARILVADDVPLNRELIRGYFHGSHHELYEAENGEQAIVLCKKYRPDIVLIDIRMPVMDGRETRLRLKSMEETKNIPLIALSASSLLNSQAELKALFDGFADKPLNRARLFTELSRFLPKAEIKPIPENAEVFGPEAGSDRTTDPEVLFAALIELEKAPWPDLVKLVPAQATMAFAQRLSSLAIRHESAILAEYATNLRKAAETLDLESAGKLLKVFPQTVRYFSHSDD